MMTVHKLSAGDGYTYLTRQVASGDRQRRAGEDLAGYYAETGNPPGRWLGSGITALGVSGEVSEPQMVALFGQGIHPDADRITDLEHAAGADERAVRRAIRLGQPFPKVSADSARKPVAGYDLVFTPVKSVSLLWALGDERVRKAVEEAHHEAVATTIGWLEQDAAFTRTGKGGIAQVDTQGLVCAAFEHRDSRLGDPDLHTHVAVSNKVCTRAAEGRPRWLALDGRALYQAGVAASERYNTRLEDAVARRLGVQFSERSDTVRAEKRSVREVAGISLGLIQRFSQRRRQVEQRYADLAANFRTAHGREPSKAAQIKLAQQATLETREGKQRPKALGEQLQQWRTQARQILHDRDPRNLITGVIGQQVPATAVDVELVCRTAAQVLSTVETERATWTRWNLIAEIERATRSWRFPTSADRERAVEAVFSAATDPSRSIRITVPELVAEPHALQRADGQSVFTPHGSERYTSERTLAAEEALVAAGQEAASVTVSPELAEQVVRVLANRTGKSLDPGQAALVEAFTTNNRRLLAGIGPAGSGKTTAMRAACAVWDADGRRVVPLAASAKAADVLSAELGRRAENLHKFLHELDSPTTPGSTRLGDREFFALRRGDVVLVDEAGMAGTHRLHRLVEHAQATGAVVRLLGDPCQLAAPEAGGALRLLATDVGAVELTALHRFTHPDEAAATLGLRRGDAAALNFYERHDRIRSGSQEAMVEQAFEGWRADMLAGRTAVMGTATTELAAELSARARLDRAALGVVDLDGVRLHDGNTAGAGDWVLTRDNHRHLLTHGGRDFVKNGDRWIVTARHPNGSLTVRHQQHRGTVTLPADYVAEHVELAYATTAHRMQGDTVDSAHPIIGAGTSREALYVLASRARDHTTLYVATEPAVDVANEHAPPNERSARDVLTEVLATEASQKSATETVRTALADGTRLSRMSAQYSHAADEATRRPQSADWTSHLQQRAAAIREQAQAQHPTRPPIPPPVSPTAEPSQTRQPGLTP
ncbi:MAG TPA: MobF family relaxase [Nocardioidaceae bacterium]|nr:MobF family relaxase [Nocardioidaceae bacterium]